MGMVEVLQFDILEESAYNWIESCVRKTDCNLIHATKRGPRWIKSGNIGPRQMKHFGWPDKTDGRIMQRKQQPQRINENDLPPKKVGIRNADYNLWPK